MKLIKAILILSFIIIGFNANAQKIKFKKGKVLIDGIECFKYENESAIMTTIYSLDDDEIISFEYVQVTSYDPNNAAGFDTHFDTYFAESDIRADLKFSGRKKFFKALIKSKVLKDCALNQEKLKSFINKYSL